MNGSTLRTHAAHRDTWRSLLRVLGLCLSLAVAGGLLSCYKPDFSTAIYKCDVYTCPKGQVCNTDQLCVQFPVEGCLNGGFSVEDGDQLRKVLSKKHKARQLRDLNAIL